MGGKCMINKRTIINMLYMDARPIHEHESKTFKTI